MRLLLVEDEKELSRALAKMLGKDGYDVDCVYDGLDGLNFSLSGLYDLIILDVIMPKMNGFEVLAELRRKKVETPILMLTALSDEHDKVAGLDRGADDYVAKPFSVEELSARIRALLRRRGKLVTDNKLEYAEATLDLMTFTLSTPKGEINLTAKEFDLLELLVRNPNKVYSRESLLTYVWGNRAMENGDVRMVDVHVRRLREKIEPSPSDPKYVHTKWGVGYYFRVKG